MTIVHSDSVFSIATGQSPDYNKGNSLLQLMKLIERVRLAAGREYYFQNSLQFLFPFSKLELFNPQGADSAITDPTLQDNKTDFQKQNIKSFETADTFLVRGLVTIGNWTGPFLKISYQGNLDSRLSIDSNNTLKDKIFLWLKVHNTGKEARLVVPYNTATDRYEIEIWGYPDQDAFTHLDELGKEALQKGHLLIQPDLVKGSITDFEREKLNDQNMFEVAKENLMHPIIPLHIELAWANAEQAVWDSQNGANYHYEFCMVVRGWDNYLSAGISANPHGGIGFLEYRNLLSNYGRFAGSNELARKLENWNFNAFGKKQTEGTQENFFTVDYMDLHIMKGGAGIGLHRHRDNQEAFLMMDGDACQMVIGDWCKMPNRERCFEVRALMPGHMALLKGGQFHGLMNSTDTDIFLFMFGGYD